MSKYQKPSGSFISFMSNMVKQNGGINLAQGIPGFQPPNELIEILNQISSDPIHQYAPGTGDLDLVNELVKKYKDFPKEQFLVVNGGTEALSLLYTYLSQQLPEDSSTMAFDPVYESYKHLPRIFNRSFTAWNLNDTEIDFDALKAEIIEKKVKIFFVGSPGNPYGRALSKKEFNTLCDLAEELDFYLILDAVYKELYFENPPYIPLQRISKNIFYTNSFSKLFSITGWRVGYLISHPAHMEGLKAVHDFIGLSTPSVLQKAIAYYLRDFNFGKKYIQELRERMNSCYKILSEALLKHGFEIPEVAGGYFIWAKLPEKYTDGFEFCMDLYEKEKIALIPGEHFSAKARNYVRINIARDNEEIKKAIEGFDRFLQDS